MDVRFIPSDPQDLRRQRRRLWEMVEKFAGWLEASGYASYDPYDIWGTRYGSEARRLYYGKHPLGALLTAPVVLMEMFAPRLRRLFVAKCRYATADAQLALAFLNLFEVCREKERSASPRESSPLPSASWLKKAEDLAGDLLRQRTPGYTGACWGYPFDWQHGNGRMSRGTPHITATPYCYEAFTRLFELTGKAAYLDVARSIARFVCDDLNDTPTGLDSAASSYTPHDHGKVVNASAYRAFVLFDAARRFDCPTYAQKAWKNLRFILQAQEPEGWWLYAIDSPAEAFIDHFHTCFVLKNLFKINRILRSDDLARSIRRGYEWYRRELFTREEIPKSFAIAPRRQIVRLEMYDVAEAISLGVLLRKEIPQAYAVAEHLTASVLAPRQLGDGHWVTRIYVGGVRHTTPFLRWPQAQLFYALTNVLTVVEGRAAPGVGPRIRGRVEMPRVSEAAEALTASGMRFNLPSSLRS